MEEIWKSIKDYEGLYEVSNWGRVRSVDKWVNGVYGCKRWIKGGILRPGKTANGYMLVSLHKGSTVKTYYIHRLVAMAFIPNPDGLPEVNHIDENKTNNNIDNLEWCTRLKNARHGTGIERMAKAHSKKVYMYTLDDSLCGMWPSTKECERNGFDSGNIAKCCNGKYKKYKGFKWSYEPPMPPKALPYFGGCM